MALRLPEKTQAREQWPALKFTDWRDTCETLHMWTQIVGKVRLALNPWVNHWWHVPLYITARGLTTSPIPDPRGGGRNFEISFDFIDHELCIVTNDGTSKSLPLIPRTVSDFYDECMASLRALGIEVTINPLPCEVPNPVPFDQDTIHHAYDPVAVQHFWRILTQTEQVLQRYREPFLGKSSPIHFFWGSFDLALTFFSGRPAPAQKGADRITREAYSHEVLSCGFWPGNEKFPEAAFYAYAIPAPSGYAKLAVRPSAAFYDADLGEFVLRYNDVRRAKKPEQMLFDFFQSTYEGGATLAHWDRAALEKRATR